MDEKYEHRPNDHLVEPFLGGLGVEHEAAPAAPGTRAEEQPTQESWWRRWLKKWGLRGD